MTKGRRWALLVTVSAGLLMITLDNSILYTALPTLTEELGASKTQQLWIINAYPLVMAGLLMGAGSLGDRFGHKKLFLVGLTIFGIASAIAAFAPSPEVLIAARAVLAVGAAAMMPATLALIRVTFGDDRERNLAIAIWGSLAVVGAALGPIIGGLLLEAFWWGSVFLINVPVVVAAIIATLILAPRNAPNAGATWDLLSSLQVMVGLAGLVFAVKEITKVETNWVIAGVAVVATVAGFVTFTRRQHTLTHPLLDFSIFRNPAVSAGVLGAGFAMFTIAGVQLVTTERAQVLQGMSPMQAGVLVAWIAIGSLPSAVIGGAMLHLTGLRPLISGGLALGGLGAIAIVVALPHGGWWTVGALLLTGAGLGLVMAVASSAIVGNVPVARAGMASSVEEVSYELGSLTAVAVLGSLAASIYTSVIVLPAGVPAATGESASAAFHYAETLTGPAREALEQAATAAYDTAYVVTITIIAVFLIAAAIGTAVLLRARTAAARDTAAAGNSAAR